MTVEEAKGSARVRLGHSDLTVRPVGLGCMGMSQFYGAADDSESVETIRSAIDLGVDFLDTSDVYGAALIATATNVRGFGHNEQLIGAALHGRRHNVVLATKFGVKVNDAGNGIVLDGRPEYVAAACEASLRRLDTDVIDLYYCHRLDPSVPIEDTVGAMAQLVTAGKVRALGLSEVGPELIRRAHAVHRITALQSEYSLWERRVEGGIAATCRELGITLVPFSPLGRSALTGVLKPGDTFDSTTSGRAIRGSRPTTSRPTSNRSRPLPSWPPTRAADPDSWPWHGCWPNRWAWYRFREPSALRTSGRISRPLRSQSASTKLLI